MIVLLQGSAPARRLLPILSIIVAISVAFSAGVTPWVDALGGIVRPPDFAQDLAAARLSLRGELPYSGAFQAEHASVYGSLNTRDGYPYLPHPPFAIVLAMPLAQLPLRSAAPIWFAASLVLLFVLAIFMADAWTVRCPDRKSGPPMSSTVIFFVLLLAWPPVLYHLEKGQFSILLAALIAIAGRSLDLGRVHTAGACVGIATSIKLFPVILGGYLLLRARWAIPMAVTCGMGATAAALAIIGEGTLTAFLAHSAANVEYWATWPAVTYGVHGITARSLAGGQWATPLVQVPVLAKVTYLACATALGTLALIATQRSTTPPSVAWSLWSILLVLLNPLAMPHNAVLLAVPLAGIGARLRDNATVLSCMVWLLTVGLVSIPRQTLSGLVVLPATPWAGLFVTASPCWGTLLLFWLTLDQGRPGQRE